jgi:hypothetical protein
MPELGSPAPSKTGKASTRVRLVLTGLDDFERLGRVAPSMRNSRLSVQKLDLDLRIGVHGGNYGLLVLSAHDNVITQTNHRSTLPTRTSREAAA